uniref:Uncharacterized protein n=1 Tax=Lepeophtheirus salmonis TaxID=72036 RepID=A0A0K2U6D1_LEPSM
MPMKVLLQPPSRVKRHLMSSSHIKSMNASEQHLTHDDSDKSNTYFLKMLVSCNIPCFFCGELHCLKVYEEI